MKGHNDCRKELRHILRSLRITRAEAAEILEVSKGTLDNWLRPETSRSQRTMPARQLEIMREIAKSAPAGTDLKTLRLRAAEVRFRRSTMEITEEDDHV